MNEPFSPLLAAVAATRAPHAQRRRKTPAGLGPVSRPLPDARVGVPDVVNHGLLQAPRTRHYDPIVCGYQPAVRTTGGPW
jgi:hypothetical protein